jgi:hypothetical protein
MNNLVEVLRSQGNYDEAETIHRRALEVREKVLGTEHPDTLSSVYGLANLNQYRKQYDKCVYRLSKSLLRISEDTWL